MHTLLFRLKTSSTDEKFIARAYSGIADIHNKLVRHMQKQLRMLKRDKRYREYIQRYHRLKDLADKPLPGKKDPGYKQAAHLLKNYKKQLAHVKGKLNDLVGEYGLTKNDCEKYVKPLQHKYKDVVHSAQAQKEADRVYDGIADVLYGKGKRIHFKRYNEFHTITCKSADTGIRFYKDAMCIVSGKHTIYINDKKLQTAIEDPEEPAPADVQYRIDSLQHDISYCEIMRKLFNDGWHYYVRLYLDGDAPKKLAPGTGTTGIDPGVTTVAAAGESFVLFDELAPRSKTYNGKIARLQYGIDVSMRISNPDNYNEDGTCKKGRHKWKFSKNCTRNRRRIAVLYRKKSDYIRQAHNELCNELNRQSGAINIEDMDYKALAKRSGKTERSDRATEIQLKTSRNGKTETKTVYKFNRKKRFGKSINDRAPALLLTILKTKCALYDIPVITVNTKTFKASQYDHNKDKYIKIPLSQRSKKIGKRTVQRDLYSAFLIRNSNQDGTHADIISCKKTFRKFIKMHDKFVEDIKLTGKRMPNFGM